MPNFIKIRPVGAESFHADAPKIPPEAEILVESSWNVMAHGDAREGWWRENWRIELVSSTLHTTSEHGVSSITTADVHTSAASCRLNWRPYRFKSIRSFRRKTKSGVCECAITFQLASTREAILCLRNLVEKSFAVNIKVYFEFVELLKAFDNVKWNVMMKTLKMINP